MVYKRKSSSKRKYVGKGIRSHRCRNDELLYRTPKGKGVCKKRKSSKKSSSKKRKSSKRKSSKCKSSKRKSSKRKLSTKRKYYKKSSKKRKSSKRKSSTKRKSHKKSSSKKRKSHKGTTEFGDTHYPIWGLSNGLTAKQVDSKLKAIVRSIKPKFKHAENTGDFLRKYYHPKAKKYAKYGANDTSVTDVVYEDLMK